MLHLSNVRQWHSSSHTLEGHLMKMQSGTTLSSSMSFLMVLFVSFFYIPFLLLTNFLFRPLSIGTCTSGWELPGVSISFDQYGIGRNLEWFQSPKQNSFLSSGCHLQGIFVSWLILMVLCRDHGLWIPSKSVPWNPEALHYSRRCWFSILIKGEPNFHGVSIRSSQMELKCHFSKVGMLMMCDEINTLVGKA